MPELPEVETMCRGIAAIVGHKVIKVERPPCQRRPIAIKPKFDQFRRRVEGRTVVAIARAGKRVVIWLEKPKNSSSVGRVQGEGVGKEAIVIEPRMTGLVLLADPPTQEHLRLRMQLGGKPKLNLLFWDRRGLGSVRLLSAQQFAVQYGENSKTLGPDALKITADELRSRLYNSRRAIKVALLDQKAIAGVGNLYASEMLHVAGIHPGARCHLIRRQVWIHLHDAMHQVLEDAIRYEGSTLADGTYRNVLNESGGYQNHHRVYDRAGDSCPTCGGGPIRRIVQAQRSTFFCPNCQRR